MLFSMPLTVVIREHKLPTQVGAFTLPLRSQYQVLQYTENPGPILIVQESAEEEETQDVSFELVETGKPFEVSPRSDERNHIASFRLNDKLLHLIGPRQNKRLGGVC